MLHLRVFVPTADAAVLARRLTEFDGVKRVMYDGRSADDAVELISAEIAPSAADAVLGGMINAGIPPESISLERSASIASLVSRAVTQPLDQNTESFIWAEVVGEARANSRLLGQFIAAMAVAGIIGAFGIIEASVILIVGAMAVSPDLLPLSAACVGIVGQKWRLTARALSALFVGLGVAVLAAAASAGLFRAAGWLPHEYDVHNDVLGSLSDFQPSTIAIAIASGVAGMLAFETRASSAVGVAISVTTIPIAALLGVAMVTGGLDRTGESISVLLVNQVSFIIGGVGTLAVQQLIVRIRASRTTREPAVF